VTLGRHLCDCQINFQPWTQPNHDLGVALSDASRSIDRLPLSPEGCGSVAHALNVGGFSALPLRYAFMRRKTPSWSGRSWVAPNASVS
jgi:hypothetical protein